MTKEKPITKIYLLRVCAYRLSDERCNVWDNESIVFLDLKSAVKAGKKILKEQLTKLWKTDEDFDVYKNIVEFLNPREEKADYVFEVCEMELHKIKSWHWQYDWNTQYSERDFIENPLFVCWSYDFEGNLLSRKFCRVDDKHRLSGGGWRSYPYVCVEFLPDDELPDAGTKFKLGDLVVKKHNEVLNRRNIQIYIIGECPERKDGRLFSQNEYMCYFIQDGKFEYISHDHLHESELELYTGEAPASFKWLSDVVAGKIKISEEDRKKVFNGEVSFAEEISYKDIKILK